MQVRTSLPIEREPCILALGNFDGVHIGHRRLLEHGLEQAKRLGVGLDVLIFEPHPLKVLFPERGVKLLSTTKERLLYMEEIGVRNVYHLPFTMEMANTSPEHFVEKILLPLGVIHVVVGFNYSFGAQGKGNPELLQALGQQHGFGVSVLQAQTMGGRVISSSSIRKALLQGDIRLASSLLGRLPCLRGTVIHGEERGRLLGYPTANILTSEDFLIPKRGVYAVWSSIDGTRILGMMNIGMKPTFHEMYDTVVEVHFFNYDGDLYGREITVMLEERLRDERKFNGVNELLAQLEKDCSNAKSTLELCNFTKP
ncbi:bifunctional riboflavin kinase/FAD synthetase [Desulfosporosinus sp.]|uniref:bifunctional riboflavin kinase/FAD synthetase n=1 Tax=Desulfosporosinus sp. TaxID=157907 RepID=UPI000E86A3BC|nr:bifunctional riboflavin kinase/FAD synthetase [Desulfosporosinus sp.]MBC2722000.1 bifunctional riboflavin kinase/FAD synthetase [Desulfosporosinus sp.]MBC2728316.1 bifunctional riboflavin kinase/FAD synthetase [Desulfosporosinus sp.]HBV87327.1 riboflavin biosynthesis protein RibF [Desulfosporosinus sp.]